MLLQFLESAEAGDAAAMCELGKCYSSGELGCELNHAQVGGSSPGLVTLGVLFFVFYMRGAELRAHPRTGRGFEFWSGHFCVYSFHFFFLSFLFELYNKENNT